MNHSCENTSLQNVSVENLQFTTAHREVKEAFHQGSGSMNVLAPNEAPPASRDR